MKYIFVMILAFCEGKTFWQTSFVDIVKSLSQTNYEVSVIVDKAHMNQNGAFPFDSFAEVPHTIANFNDGTKTLKLTSSAIVLLQSADLLMPFNDRVILPSKFSTRQQLFVYCEDQTFDKIAVIEETATMHRSIIVQHEYFVVEEETSVRLLTFVWYTPERCNFSQLVEINRFDKSSKRWLHGIFKIEKFSNFHGCQITFWRAMNGLSLKRLKSTLKIK